MEIENVDFYGHIMLDVLISRCDVSVVNGTLTVCIIMVRKEMKVLEKEICLPGKMLSIFPAQL
jgi:hypothetical protein